MPVYPRDGFMPTATALVVASDASPALIAAAREAKDRLGDLIQICDGVDDHLEIQAAIDALPSGGETKLSVGTFNISSKLVLKHSGDTLKGQNYNKTIVKASGAMSEMLDITDGIGRNLIEDIYFDGDSKATNIIDFTQSSSDAYNQRFNRVHTRNANGGYDFILNGNEDTSLTGCLVAGKVQWYVPGGAAWITDTYIGDDLEAQAQVLSVSGSVLYGVVNTGTSALQVVRLDGVYLYESSGGKNMDGSGVRIVYASLKNCYIINTTSNGAVISGEISRGVAIEQSHIYHEDIDIYLTDATSQFSNAKARLHLQDVFKTSGIGTLTNLAPTADIVLTTQNSFTVASGEIVTISKTVDHADIVDDGGASGHADFDETIPAGSIIKGVKFDYAEAFNSDNTTSLTIQVGLQADLDAFNKTLNGENGFNTTTDDFWGESDCQEPTVVSAATPRITFTEDDDITHLISGAGAQGAITITITYMKA